MHRLYTSLIVLAGGLVVSSVSCTPTGATQYVLPEELPPGIEAVIAAGSSVRVEEDDTFFDGEADAIVDDVSSLDGCFGAYIPLDGTNQYEFLSFDADTGEMSRAVYALSTTTTLGLLVSYYGEFTIQNENELRFDVESISTADPVTGQIRSLSPADVNEDGSDELIFRFLITLDGNRIRIVLVDQDTGQPATGDERQVSVGVRITCP